MVVSGLSPPAMERGKPHLLTLHRGCCCCCCHTPFVSPAELRVGPGQEGSTCSSLICWANTVTVPQSPLCPSPAPAAACPKSNLPNIARALSNNDPEKSSKAFWLGPAWRIRNILFFYRYVSVLGFSLSLSVSSWVCVCVLGVK